MPSIPVKQFKMKILGIAADQIRGFYRSCLHRCSLFSLIADEVTSTILELYPYIVKTWEHMCYPCENDSIYTNGNDWNWDSESCSSVNGIRHTFTSFEHVVTFFLAKELLEPIRLLLNAYKEDYCKCTLVSRRLLKL